MKSLLKCLLIGICAFLLSFSFSIKAIAQCPDPHYLFVSEIEPYIIHIDYIGDLTGTADFYEIDVFINNVQVYNGTTYNASDSIEVNLSNPLQHNDWVEVLLYAACINGGQVIYSIPLLFEGPVRGPVATIEEVYNHHPFDSYCEKENKCEYAKLYHYEESQENQEITIYTGNYKILDLCNCNAEEEATIADVVVACDLTPTLLLRQTQCDKETETNKFGENWTDSYKSNITPNPIGNTFSLQFNSEEEIKSLHFFSIEGKEHFVQYSASQIQKGVWWLEFDSSILESGLYLLNIETSRDKFTWRILKE